MAEGKISTTTITTLTSKTITTTSISDLPQLPLLIIFDKISLLNLLRIDEVCRAWKELKPAALSRRRHLVITNDRDGLNWLTHPGLESDYRLLKQVLNEDGSPYLEPRLHLDLQALFINRYLPPLSATLFELLPNLKVLRLVHQYGSIHELWKVNQLLTHYRHQLVELTIWFWGWRTSCEPNQTEVQHAFQKMFLSLMTCLNRLTALRSLELNFWAAPGCPVILDDNQMATHCLPDVAGRLKWLKFITCFEFDDSGRCGSGAADARLLKQILFQMRDKNKSGEGDGSKVKQQQPKKQEALELYVNKIPLTLQTLIPLGPGPVAAGLRSVKIDGVFSGNSEAQYKALARFARQSPHLQALTLGLKSLNIHRLVESLAPLKELVNLSIFCYPANSPLSETVNIDGQLPVMPSVKSLELSFSPNSHHDYQQLHLEVLFPNLQTVDWSHLGWGCPNCGYLISQEELLIYETDPQPDGMQFRADYGRQMQRCLRLARLAAFSQLPRLTHLWLNVRPCNVYIPFKSQLFTNCSQSLHRLREFVDQTETTDRDSFLVVYDD